MDTDKLTTKYSIEQTTEFFMALDQLKLINRRSYIAGGARLENSAEHSWHLALGCWLFAEKFQLKLDTEKLIKMALVHDLGEIDAGDTFLYSKQRNQVSEKERAGVVRIAGLAGNEIPDIVTLWDEQEQGESMEARVLKVVDRLLPFNHNIHSGGQAWIEHRVQKNQVLDAHRFIGEEFPDVYTWVESKVNEAVARGWLLSD